MNTAANDVAKKYAWYDNNFVIFGSLPASLLCLFLPIGLIPLWLSRRFDKRAKQVLTAVFCLPLVSWILLACLSSALRAIRPTSEGSSTAGVSASSYDGPARYKLKSTDTSQPGKTVVEVEVEYHQGMAPSPEQLSDLAEQLHRKSTTPDSTFIFFMLPNTPAPGTLLARCHYNPKRNFEYSDASLLTASLMSDFSKANMDVVRRLEKDYRAERADAELAQNIGYAMKHDRRIEPIVKSYLQEMTVIATRLRGD